MLRIVVSATLIAFVSSAVVAQERSLFRAGAQPEGKKSPQPESREKIIGEIRTDFDSAVEKLNRQDPGRQTRVLQDRILDNLKKLLDPDDDTPPPSSNSSNPPPPMMQPSGAEPNSPEPSSELKPKSSPQPESKPKQPGQPESKPLESKMNRVAKESSPMQLPPQAKEESRDETRKSVQSGAWPGLPSRHRQQIDAVSGDRFVPRYEDLLREYYRALADGGRRE